MDIDDGNLSIETAISFPIFIIVLLTFIYIINMLRLSDNIMHDLTIDVLTNGGYTYECFLNNLPYKINLTNNVYSKRFDNFAETHTIENDILNINIEYEYIFPAIFLKPYKCEKCIKSKIFAGGIDLLQYDIESKLNLNEDIWSLSNLDRAKVINEIENGYDKFNGTHIDKIINGKLVSIVSMDFRKESYSNRKNISAKLRRDINQLYNFKEGYVNDKYVKANEYEGKIFNLILPTQNYDVEVEKELQIVRNYCNNKKIIFRISIIN